MKIEKIEKSIHLITRQWQPDPPALPKKKNTSHRGNGSQSHVRSNINYMITVQKITKQTKIKNQYTPSQRRWQLDPRALQQ